MLTVNPKEVKQSEVQKWLTGGVAPRPIALVSTLSADGIRNLSPFSFFNAFGSNPPVVAFSPSRRGRDNTLKDTYNNLIDTKECVIHAVTMDIVHQINLASSEFPPETDEFYMSGFTPVESQFVKPYRVKESPFAMECKLLQMIELGGTNGSGNLAVCEVVLFHIDESVLTNNAIDPFKIHHTGRNGGNWYTRADQNSMYNLPKPSHDKAIGYYALPEYLRNSEILTANDLAKMALTDKLPSKEEADKFFELIKSKIEHSIYELDLITCLENSGEINISNLEKCIKAAIDSNNIDFALNLAVFGKK
jgi:flavin reductase (DIM6/NTAB) family NADH-FMN oxidoreductase RutF